jgi:hypothetical protein
MRRKLLKMFLPFLGIGVVTIPVALTVTSCAEKGMPTKYISSILQTYRNEASINIPGDDDHIINVGIIGSFPDNPIKQDAFKEDIKNWDNTTSGKPYDQATADAISYSDVITAPIKT